MSYVGKSQSDTQRDEKHREWVGSKEIFQVVEHLDSSEQRPRLGYLTG